ncbi:LuxR family two component transcriptional regulator [Sphaerotilus hippei]|uniref:LuxR family two component transcriptional regulator n=1 Tax=Sphaerotilus hippei TaxID=744406 RepID=A0A318GUV2_9BURK|nr:response regulator transcription factor [Sphaerotilus hippei]PXW92352.1 LuxR family two component transcriptional regulator [Sphaerotilus hippei]
MRAIRVLVCDDHFIVRQGLRQTLGAAPDVMVIDEAGSSADCLSLAQRLMPDVLLLDLALAGRDGLETLTALRTLCPRVPVLMLSTYPERLYAVRCMQQGASGYLHKSTGASELLQAIRALAAGLPHLTPAVADALARAMSPQGEPAGAQPWSPREHQILLLLASGRTVEQIARQLALSSNTVSTCRARLLEKTGAHDEAGLARHALSRRPILSRSDHEPQ